MKPIDVIKLRKQHLDRLANQTGAYGEAKTVDNMSNWLPRPRGVELKTLLATMADLGITIKGSSFDALSHPHIDEIDFTNKLNITEAFPELIFIEIKTANQDRVKSDFSGFFFALTESEILASEALGKQHVVALYNKKTEVIKMSSVGEIIGRSKSTTWQVSVQL